MQKYRVDQNEGLSPREGKPLVQAEDLIETRGVFRFVIQHVLVYDEPRPRRGFAPAIRVGGLTTEALSPHFGEDDDAYQRAKAVGDRLLDRKTREVSGNAVPAS